MRKLPPIKIVFLIIGGMFIVACIFVSIKVAMDQPQNLGPELEYIGKEHTGCPLPLPLGYIMLCSSEPGEEYYFATDLSVQEVKEYFRNATPFGRQSTGSSADYTYSSIGFKPNFTNETFRIAYFDDSNYIFNKFRAKTSRKNVISLSSDAYKIAKMSLQ